jgi:hypothetical protein
MISLSILPVFIAIFIWGSLFIALGGYMYELFYTPLEGYLSTEEQGFLLQALEVLVSIFIYLLIFVFFLIAVIATNAIVAGFYAPFVISYLHKKYYSDVEISGFGSLTEITIYFVKTLGLFLFLLLLAIPLYFIPMVGFLVPILIFFWFYKKNIIFDVGTTMLSQSEYKELTYHHRHRINVVSFATYLVGYVPVVNLFAAILQLLAISHMFFHLKRGV